MPDTPISRMDMAVAASTANAVAVFRGPNAIPLADPSFTWDPTNKLHTLKGQAGGLGGNRWNLQDNVGGNFVFADNNGTLWSNLKVNPTNFAFSLQPQSDQAVGFPASWDINCTSSSNGDTTSNNVVSGGHNMRLGGGSSSWRWGMESHWLTGGGTYYQKEFHLGGYYPAPFNPNVEIRCWTMNVHEDTGNAQTQSECSSMGQNSEGSFVGIWKSERNGVTGDYAWTVFNGASGTHGYPFQLTSSATAGDTLSIGRDNVPVVLNLGGGSGYASKFIMSPGGQAVIGGTDVSPSACFAIFPASTGLQGLAINMPSGSTQSMASFSANGTTAFAIGHGGQLVSTALVGTSYAVDLTAASSSYPLALNNNGFILARTTTASDQIILGISSDNNTYLLSHSGQDIRLSPGGTISATFAAGGAVSFVGPIGVNGASPPAKAANPGTATGTDAAVINAITTILRNVGFCL